MISRHFALGLVSLLLVPAFALPAGAQRAPESVTAASCADLAKGRPLPCAIDFAAFRQRPPAVAASQDGRTHVVRSAAELNALKLGPGDQAVLADGSWSNARIDVRAAGSPARPIVIRGQTPGGVVLSGSSSARFSGAHLVVADLTFRDGLIGRDNSVVLQFGAGDSRPCNACVADSLVIESYNSAPEDYEKLKSFYVVAQGQDITIANSTFRNKQNVGAVVLASDPNDRQCSAQAAATGNCIQRFTFRNNVVSDVSKDVRHRRLDAGKYVVMQIGGSRTATARSFSVIEGNVFEHADGGTNTLSIKVSDIAIRNNLFRANLGTIDLRSSNRALVEGNVFDGTDRVGMGGITVTGAGHWIVGNRFRNLVRPINDFHMPIAMPAAGEETLRDGSNDYARARDVVIADNTFENVVSPPIALGIFPKPAIGRTLKPTDIYVSDNSFKLAEPAGAHDRPEIIRFVGPRQDFSGIHFTGNRIER